MLFPSLSFFFNLAILYVYNAFCMYLYGDFILKLQLPENFQYDLYN